MRRRRGGARPGPGHGRARRPRGGRRLADSLRSAETYLGYRQGDRLRVARCRSIRRADHDYWPPGRLPLNGWALSGTWTVAGHAVVGERARRADRLPVPRPRREPRDGPGLQGAHRSRSEVYLDGEPAGDAHGTDVAADGSGTVSDQRTYQLIRQPGRSRAPLRDRVPRRRRRGLLLHVRLRPRPSGGLVSSP